jgi:hypothetical protein
MKVNECRLYIPTPLFAFFVDVAPSGKQTYILSSLAFIATITVLILMRAAPTAGLSSTP